MSTETITQQQLDELNQTRPQEPTHAVPVLKGGPLWERYQWLVHAELRAHECGTDGADVVARDLRAVRLLLTAEVARSVKECNIDAACKTDASEARPGRGRDERFPPSMGDIAAALDQEQKDRVAPMTTRHVVGFVLHEAHLAKCQYQGADGISNAEGSALCYRLLNCVLNDVLRGSGVEIDVDFSMSRRDLVPWAIENLKALRAKYDALKNEREGGH